jgi:mono/diheme cytochrome c family protein
MKRLLVLLLLLLAVSAADASQYVFHDGYWWWGGQAYTRTAYWYPGNGCTPGYWYYRYTPVDVPASTVPYTADWKTQLLKVKEKQADYQAYLQALREAGLTVPYAPPLAGGYSLSGTLHYGATGSTLYGYGGSYTYQQPGSIDLNLLYQQAAQLAAQSQRLGGEATANFQGLVGQAGTNQARTAEILARGQVAQQILAALALPPTAEMKSFSFKVVPGGTIETDRSKVSEQDKAALLEQWKEHARNTCLACHNAQNKKGGFNVGEYPDMTPEQKQRVIETLTTADEKKRMPRDANGGAGKRLTAEELRLWLLN